MSSCNNPGVFGSCYPLGLYREQLTPRLALPRGNFGRTTKCLPLLLLLPPRLGDEPFRVAGLCVHQTASEARSQVNPDATPVPGRFKVGGRYHIIQGGPSCYTRSRILSPSTLYAALVYGWLVLRVML